jgi:hypothetical protein
VNDAPQGKRKLMQKLVGSVVAACLVSGVLASGSLVAVQAAKPGVRFSSAYTITAKDCKDDGPESDNGSDTPLICKGSGIYKLAIGYSAFGASLRAVAGETDVSLGEVDFAWDQNPGRKLEWRLANGKPFAAIYRVNTYRDIATNIENGKNPFAEANRDGSRVVVVGLKGFENLNSEFNGKDVKANDKARALADSTYAKR